MTRAEQIKKAKAILARSVPSSRPDLLDDLDDLIGDALDRLDENATEGEQSTKARSAKTKAELRTLTKRLRSARNSANRLPSHVSALFSDKLDELLQLAAAWERLPPGPRHRTSYRQQMAVGYADFLLAIHGLPIKVSRGRDFHRLAAILYGDEKADLYRHMRSPGAEHGR